MTLKPRECFPLSQKKQAFMLPVTTRAGRSRRGWTLTALYSDDRRVTRPKSPSSSHLKPALFRSGRHVRLRTALGLRCSQLVVDTDPRQPSEAVAGVTRPLTGSHATRAVFMLRNEGQKSCLLQRSRRLWAGSGPSGATACPVQIPAAGEDRDAHRQRRPGRRHGPGESWARSPFPTSFQVQSPPPPQHLAEGTLACVFGPRLTPDMQ